MSDGIIAAGAETVDRQGAPQSRTVDVEVHVVDLTGVEPRPEHLGQRERARLERLRIDAKRHQFAAAQTALRAVLGRRLDCDPASVELAYGDHGKPCLARRPDLGFNLTHSGCLALVAMASGPDIGVDVEFRGRRRPFLRLSRRYFAASEHEWLARQGAALAGSSFYRAWVLKESYLKAVGSGLTFPPSGFVLDLDEATPRLQSTQLPGDSPGNWSLRDLRVHAEYAAALCVRGTLRRVEVFDFPGRQ